jgi:nucleoid-associated protein YgaU
MRTIRRLSVMLSILLSLAAVTQAQEMTKDQWQQSMREATQKRDALQKEVQSLEADVVKLKTENSTLAQQLDKCHQELLALLGTTDAKLKAFGASLDKIDKYLNDLSGLSNQDLLARKAELDTVQAMITGAKSDKMSYLPDFTGRLQEEQIKLDALKQSLKNLLASSGQYYTVGTWGKNRDCLWNISKKPNVYDNAFLWPKIWQGNRDQIKNPDIIHPGQKLKIPAKAPLTAQETSAMKLYWHQRVEVGDTEHPKSAEK